MQSLAQSVAQDADSGLEELKSLFRPHAMYVAVRGHFQVRQKLPAVNLVVFLAARDFRGDLRWTTSTVRMYRGKVAARPDMWSTALPQFETPYDLLYHLGTESEKQLYPEVVLSRPGYDGGLVPVRAVVRPERVFAKTGPAKETTVAEICGGKQTRTGGSEWTLLGGFRARSNQIVIGDLLVEPGLSFFAG